MIEVEVKVKIIDREEIAQKLIALGFKLGHEKKETDIYFDNQEGNFRKSDKALRIRQCENLTTKESVSYMTYKGPKLDHISMTRKELEMKIENGETGIEILKTLGFHPVHPVVKFRQYYHKEKLTACLDQVEGLGEYLELEVIVECEERKEEALAYVISVLSDLGYRQKEVIRTSYLSMLQKKSISYEL